MGGKGRCWLATQIREVSSQCRWERKKGGNNGDTSYKITIGFVVVDSK